MSNSSKIFVIYHQPGIPFKSDVFTPIAVGKNKDLFSEGYLRDDIGENIADKNSTYNELTAIYWVYKHIDEFKDVEYFGFSHYRRLFCFNGNKKAYVRKQIDEKLVAINSTGIDSIFRNYGFVAPRASHYTSVRKHYEKSHNKTDLDNLLKAIENVAPSYLEDAKEYFESKNEFLYNMFVFKKEDFLLYGKFIFDVLEEFINLSKDVNRLYVSERLTGLFIYHLLKEGKQGLFLSILHVRSKSLKLANKQVKINFKENKDCGFIYKMKPIILCFLPRCVEQHFRRRKAK